MNAEAVAYQPDFMPPKKVEVAPVEPKTGNSIFNYYSVENEIKLMKELSHLPEAERRFYISENVFKFLGEFAGQVPYTKISYLVGQNGFEYAGLNPSNSYLKVAKMAGFGSREHDEWTGYSKIEKTLQNNPAMAVWLSPPKITDYSFAFVFQPNGVDPNTGKKIVDEYILRYTEDMGTTEESKRIAQQIGSKQNSETSSDFLRKPDFLDPSKINIVLSAVGVNQLDIAKSRKFEASVKKTLGRLIYEYADYINQGDVVKAERLLATFFVTAKQIAETIQNTNALDNVRFMPINRDDLQQIHLSMKKEDLLTSGGGSCPVTRSRGGFMSSGDIYSTLSSGKTVEGSLIEKDAKNDPNLCKCGHPNSPHFHCPGKNETCNHPIIVGEGTSKCPSCGQGKTC